MGDQLNVIVGLLTVASALYGGWRWVGRWLLPRLRARRAEQVAINTVLVGRPAIPFNTITGEPAQPAIPGIGECLNAMQGSIDEQRKQLAVLLDKVHEVEHEVKNNDGSSMKDSTHRLEQAAQRADARMEAQDGQIAQIRDQLGEIRGYVEETLHSIAGTSQEALAAITQAIAPTSKAG